MQHFMSRLKLPDEQNLGVWHAQHKSPFLYFTDKSTISITRELPLASVIKVEQATIYLSWEDVYTYVSTFHLISVDVWVTLSSVA